MSLRARNFYKAQAPLMIGFLVTAGVLGRLLPHAPNATPMAALGLVAGAALGGRFAVLVPLVTLALTDIVLGTYAPVVMATVYACMAVPGILGNTVLKNLRNPLAIGICAAFSSVLFFVATNFAVWAGGGWYAPTLAGLTECYVAALPFARNMLMADLVWSIALFAGLALIEQSVPATNAAQA